MKLMGNFFAAAFFGFIAIGVISISLQDTIGVSNSDGCFIGLCVVIIIAILRSMWPNEE